jgi:hypothetical protein
MVGYLTTLNQLHISMASTEARGFICCEYERMREEDMMLQQNTGLHGK